MVYTEQAIVVGSGPAGYTAALYLARADLSPLVFEGHAWGGLLQETTDVENFPGFPNGVMGPQLMQDMRDQAIRFGARLISDLATEIIVAADGGPHRVVVAGEEYLTRTLILSMGAQHKKLGVPGEEELGGRGVSFCATCDAAFFRNRTTCVVGGGDSAMEEAIFLARFAEKVYLVHRRNEFRASPVMKKRAEATANIEFVTPAALTGFEASDIGNLAAVHLTNPVTNAQTTLEVQGAFVAIGHEPQSDLVRGQVETDEAGYVKVQGRSTLTSVRGVFAAGDLVDHTYRQAITAAGSGCQAALDAQTYLRDNHDERADTQLAAAS